MLTCALVSSDEGFRHAVLGIARQPAAQISLALNLQISADGMTDDAVAKILDAEPSVVFLDLGQDPAGVDDIRRLTQEAPEISLIVAGPALSADGLLAIMRAGVAEYLPRPLSQEETLEAFLRVRRRAAPASPASERDLGRVTTVFSAKGGTGVTTVATNLAVAIKTLTEKDVLLLDLVPAMGTASVAMGVQARYSYLDVILNFHRVDEGLFKSFMEVHESGVHILASPFTPMETKDPSKADLLGLIGLCRQYFDHVIIDGGSSISPQLLVALESADERMVVVTPELPSLRNLKQAIDLFAPTNGKGPPKVVLNQYKEGVGLSSGDVEDGLGHRLSAILERDEVRMLQSVNLGRPAVLGGKSRISKNLLDLGNEIAGPEEALRSKGTLLNRIFRPSKSGAKNGRKDK